MLEENRFSKHYLILNFRKILFSVTFQPLVFFPGLHIFCKLTVSAISSILRKTLLNSRLEKKVWAKGLLLELMLQCRVVCSVSGSWEWRKLWVEGLFDKFSFRIDFLKKEYAQAEFFMIDIPIGLKAGNSEDGYPTLKHSEFQKPWSPESSPNLAGKQCMRNTIKSMQSQWKTHRKRNLKTGLDILPKTCDLDSFLIENEDFQGKIILTDGKILNPDYIATENHLQYGRYGIKKKHA